MRTPVFEELMASAREVLDHADGKRSLKTTTLPLPPREAPRKMAAAGVRRERDRLRASQAVFARSLNVSTKLVQAWEAGRRTPDGPALVLLHLAAAHPEILEGAWLAGGSARDRGERPVTASDLPSKRFRS